EPGLRRLGSIFHRSFNGPSEIVEDYPYPGPKQQVDKRKAETCGVPCMAAVEVAEIELRTRHSLDHLGEFPGIRTLGENRRHPMRQPQCRQYLVNVRLAGPRILHIEGYEVSPSEVFKDCCEICTAFAVEETD